MLSNHSDFKQGHIQVKVDLPFTSGAPSGLQNLELDKKRDALLYVPKTYHPKTPSPFALLLHGAGGSAEHGLFLLQHLAETNKTILLAPSSRSKSWDIIDQGSFDQDVLFISQAMERVTQSYCLDTRYFSIGGFSDGASYALSLGLINGQLFSHIIAFSPGFFRAPTVMGKPRIYISHGVNDKVLPVGPCSRRIVPKLKGKGYEVTYHEFDEGHIVPEHISEEAIKWFL